MLILVLTFAAIVYQQFALLRRGPGGARDKLISFAVTGAAFLYGVLCLLFSDWMSPNEPIRFVFEPIQRWIVHAPSPSGISE